MKLKEVLTFIFLFFVSGFSCFAQMPESIISPDGKYVAYYSRGLALISVNETQKKAIVNADVLINNESHQPLFTSDSRFLIFCVSDSLVIYDLTSGETNYVSHIIKNQTYKWDYKPSNKFILVKNVGYGNNGDGLLCQRIALDGKILFSVSKTDLGIAGSDSLLSWAFSDDGEQIAFVVKKPSGQINMALYDHASQKSKVLINSSSDWIDSTLMLSPEPVFFTPDHAGIIFNLQERPLPQPDATMEKLDVWSYLDARPQSLQLKDRNVRRKYKCYINIQTGKMVRIEKENEVCIPGSDMAKGSNMTSDYALVCQYQGNVLNYFLGNEFEATYALNEYSWNSLTNESVYLVSLKTGTRTQLQKPETTTTFGYASYYFSPDEQFVIYYNAKNNNYYTYDINTRTRRNITSRISVPWNYADENERPRMYNTPCGIAGWLPRDKAVLIYDKYMDIWQVDPLGKVKPVCLTNRTAWQRQQTNVFSKGYTLIYPGFSVEGTQGESAIICTNWLMLSTYDPVYDSRRYYRIELNKAINPVLVLDNKRDTYTDLQKAATADVFLVSRESATQKPTLYSTTDFTTFHAIVSAGFTDSEFPAKRFREETLIWKAYDNKPCLGRLRFPEDFDPHKKYPVIVTYYEGTYGVNPNVYIGERIYPETDYKRYFMFTPGIHYRPGETAQSVYDCVVSGTEELAKRPYIDKQHMGITGTSFGGYETYVLITRTHLFAAASAVSGFTDNFSEYGMETVDPQGFSHMQALEVGQGRMYVTPWERPDLYLKNSPIFYADKVTTPLLMGIGRKDYRVPCAQGIEFFNAMRRLGKKAWMISYDEGGHGLRSDYGIRQKQFFDHYLKGGPAPVWMIRGIPAKLKGQTLGLEIDSVIATPGESIRMKQEWSVPPRKRLLQHATTIDWQGRVVPMKHSVK